MQRRLVGWSLVVAVSLSIAPRARADAPAGWADTPFGNLETAGSASYSDLGGGVYDITVEGAGTDIWGKSDTGRFVHTPLAGDGEVLATIPAIPVDALYGEWARQGLMMRGSLMQNTVNVFAGRNKGTPATGMRVKFSRRPTHDADTADWGGPNNFSYATNAPARLRLVRQGDTYTIWGSTNAPAFDQWEWLNSHTVALGAALNVGVVVSRWAQQTGGPATLTCAFEDVLARNLVTAATNLTGIAVGWIGDTPVTNGTVVGYALSRQDGPNGAFAALAETDGATLTYDDTSAGIGTTYVYRVHARVDVGGATNDLLVGTSVGLRRAAVFANPSPSTVNGLAAEYYQPNSPRTLVGARVDPNLDNPWFAGTVYPAAAATGLTGGGDPNYFRCHWNGSITVPETGLYRLLQSTDDELYLWVDNVQIMNQWSYLNMREIYTTPVWLEAGRRYPLRAEFSEGNGGQEVHLKWLKGTDAAAIIPASAFEPFPYPWQHRDIGDSPRFGNAVYDYATYAFTVTSGGLGIDETTGSDDGHFVWQGSAANFDLMARVSSLTGPAQPDYGAGLSIRGALTDNAAGLTLAVVAGGPGGVGRGLALVTRPTAGGAPAITTMALAETPADLRVTRRGSTLSAYYRTASSGGWVVVTNLSTSLSGTLYAGLSAFSGDTAHTATGVFDRVTFAYSDPIELAAAVANLEVGLTLVKDNPMAIRQAEDAKANVVWYWADHEDGSVTSYSVYKSDRPDTNFTLLGSATTAPTYPFADTLSASNTLAFYRYEGLYDFGAFADSSTNDIVLVSKTLGVTDGSIVGTGDGLFAAFHRAPLPDNYYTNRPVHTMIRGLTGWEKGTANTPMVAAAQSDDGVAIGPDNFQCTWAGWVEAPYTGYYWFRTQTDDAIDVWLDGTRIIYYWGYTATAQTSAPVWIEAGRRLPLQVYFQQGGGGGFFRMWWKHGLGQDGDFIGIPTNQLYPLAPDGTPLTVAPGSGSEFGAWRNIDIATGRPGYAALGGTPEAFDCTLSGGGGDIWGNSDQFHFLYQEVAENFEIEATFNSLLNADQWSKLGLMVREGTAGNARNLALITSASNGYRLQLRDTTGGGSASLAPAEIPGSGTAAAKTPVTFRLVRERGKVKAYINGTRVAYTGGIDIDVSAWNKPLCVGLAITSHNNSRLSYALVNDVTFKVIYPKGTVVILK